MTTKNYARSVRAKLLNISKEENVFYQSILTRYFQERLLYRPTNLPRSLDIYHTGTETIHGKIKVLRFGGLFYALFPNMRKLMVNGMDSSLMI